MPSFNDSESLKQGIMGANTIVRKLVEAQLCVNLHFKLNLKFLLKTSLCIIPLHFLGEDLIPTLLPEVFDLRCSFPSPLFHLRNLFLDSIIRIC